MSFDFLYVSLNCFVALLSTQMHSSEIQLFRFRSNKIWHAFTCIQNSCTVREITAFSPHSSVLMPSLNHSLKEHIIENTPFMLRNPLITDVFVQSKYFNIS